MLFVRFDLHDILRSPPPLHRPPNSSRDITQQTLADIKNNIYQTIKSPLYDLLTSTAEKSLKTERTIFSEINPAPSEKHC